MSEAGRVSAAGHSVDAYLEQWQGVLRDVVARRV